MIRPPPRSTLFPYTTLCRSVHLPMGRFAEAVEIANAAVFLASDESSYVTASTFLVDGGLSGAYTTPITPERSEEHTSELQSRQYLVCRLLLEKKKTKLR